MKVQIGDVLNIVDFVWPKERKVKITILQVKTEYKNVQYKCKFDVKNIYGEDCSWECWYPEKTILEWKKKESVLCYS
jgi:hypothetical protein